MKTISPMKYIYIYILDCVAYGEEGELVADVVDSFDGVGVHANDQARVKGQELGPSFNTSAEHSMQNRILHRGGGWPYRGQGHTGRPRVRR